MIFAAISDWTADDWARVMTQFATLVGVIVTAVIAFINGIKGKQAILQQNAVLNAHSEKQGVDLVLPEAPPVASTTPPISPEGAKQIVQMLSAAAAQPTANKPTVG